MYAVPLQYVFLWRLKFHITCVLYIVVALSLETVCMALCWDHYLTFPVLSTSIGGSTVTIPIVFIAGRTGWEQVSSQNNQRWNLRLVPCAQLYVYRHDLPESVVKWDSFETVSWIPIICQALLEVLGKQDGRGHYLSNSHEKDLELPVLWCLS